MEEVDLREENQISKGDKLPLGAMGHTNYFSFGRAQKVEVAAMKAAKENSERNFEEFLKLSVS